MKTATSDEELAFKQKEREMAMYTRKVQHLVQVDADLNACDAFLAVFSFFCLHWFAIISDNSAHLKSLSFALQITSKSMAVVNQCRV